MNIIELNKLNIKTALDDYRNQTYDTEVLDKVTDKFINRLAEDSASAKTNLRELFRKSPVWNEDLQALVINGTRTHNPDLQLVDELARKILNPLIGSEDWHKIYNAICFFSRPSDDPTDYISAINELAPDAYKPRKKKSRIFKALCDSLGVSDDSRGSNFQRNFAKFADEINAKKIDYKLFVSINPAHFLTMSNPKNDKRGDTLTSCHSFNNQLYDYNNGCSGYARDDVTFIAFTVAAPTDLESLNNRKTTRQIFAYKNSLLLQSRLYNTFGGTRGSQSDSKLYRDLIQREFSELEGVPNLWKTFPYCNNKKHIEIGCCEGFGGYPDWSFEQFDAKISLRSDYEKGTTFNVGSSGLCISCGKEISAGLLCDNCKHLYTCDDCEELCDETYEVHSYNGDVLYVCYECRQEHYARCRTCGDFYHLDLMHDWQCENCRAAEAVNVA